MRTVPQSGFTLLEILVAVVVLALGVIGASAVHLTAMRARHESLLLSNAAQLAAGMADRMRANPGQIDAVYLTLDYDAGAEPDPAAPAQLCWSADCDAAQLALADLYELKQQLRSALPAGRVRVCRDAAIWQAHRLRWECDGGAGAPVVVKIGWHGKNPDGTPRHDAQQPYAPSVAISLAGAAP
ncbi:MAG: type IV pilus modification protein PilV [Pseudomonadota bacterium]